MTDIVWPEDIVNISLLQMSLPPNEKVNNYGDDLPAFKKFEILNVNMDDFEKFKENLHRFEHHLKQLYITSKEEYNRFYDDGDGLEFDSDRIGCYDEECDFITFFHQLEKLSITYSFITNVRFLSSLDNLTHVDISNNEITSIESLSRLTKLKYIDASNNHIKNISPLRCLKNLEYIDISGNTIISMKPLFSLDKDVLLYVKISFNNFLSKTLMNDFMNTFTKTNLLQVE